MPAGPAPWSGSDLATVPSYTNGQKKSTQLAVPIDPPRPVGQPGEVNVEPAYTVRNHTVAGNVQCLDNQERTWIKVRRSFWLPMALAAILMLLVVAAQLGLTAETSAHGLTAGFIWIRTLGAPLIAAAACVAWIRTRERALLFYTIGMAAMPLAGWANRLGWPTAGLWLYPLAVIGMALAAITWAWAPATQRSTRPVIVLLIAITAAIVIMEELSIASPGLFTEVPSLPTAFNGVYLIYWAVLATVAWHGHRHAGMRPLLWLGLQGAFSALSALAGMAEVLLIPRTPLLPGWCYAVLVTLPLVMAAGVVVTANKQRASLFR